MITMNVKSGGGNGDYTPGWKTVTIKSAAPPIIPPIVNSSNILSAIGKSSL